MSLQLQFYFFLSLFSILAIYTEHVSSVFGKKFTAKTSRNETEKVLEVSVDKCTLAGQRF